jgi:HlyD family type I secretion membrane fusion protein
MLIVFIAFIGFGLWLAIAPLASAVIAPGIVVVEGNRKTVQHLESGIVKEILVKEGDRVNKGDSLIILDSTREQAGYEIISGDYYAKLTLEARLLAELNNNDTIEFSRELLEQSQKIEKINKAINGQRGIFQARKISLKVQEDILTQRVKKLKDEIVGYTVQIVAAKEQVVSLKKELNDIVPLVEKGFVPRLQNTERERRISRLQGEIGDYKADISRAEQGIGEANLQKIQLQKSFHEEIILSLREVQEVLVGLTHRMGATKDTLQKTVIKSPINGIVFNLAVHTSGAVIAAGSEIMQIVPYNTKLIIEARVNPNDIDDTIPGQDATVRFTAFKFKTTPTLTGRVFHVSADRMTDPYTGEAYYSARVEIPKQELARLNELKIQPGMPADVLIHTGTQTALEYMIAPITNSMTHAFKAK